MPSLRSLFVVGLCGGLLGCDHGTKLVAEKALGSGRIVTVVPHAMELRYARNSDVAFSALSQWDLPHKGAILLAITGIVTAVTIGFWIRHRILYRGVWGLTDAGFAFVVAGALGNVIDRAVRGYVVDFIYVSHWPVFNVADVCVVLGLIALGLSRNREPGDAPRDTRRGVLSPRA